MSTEQTRELTDRLTLAYVAGDAAAIAALLAQDVVHHPPESLGAGPHAGRAQTAAALALTPGGGALQAGSVEREVALALADGDSALVKVRVRARTADGADYRNEVVLISTWRDGEVVRIDEFGDTLNDADLGVVKDVPAWP
ncbi:nuclear transport factor 2 family protein [Conexibacter stalactiti]|uniref:Nuclear transport factor 2 family protein n=1 Tax=Conexibacter stalactiti TaxID=1940611 RepID=A0ABU4HWM4_9ACTN|nr:nuclear transport factor 2 family protein [Conexibacter stalactiti]MDW5597628.1 nuclear transport factor 2 family protein [Conexibacter stalactiti]MEC5038270.1 nuclear transport factor 2 family protein [Conexibacter stalactiti]